MNGDEYNQDYFERGIELGISGYNNYRWMPEFTIPMAMTMTTSMIILKVMLSGFFLFFVSDLDFIFLPQSCRGVS